MKDARRHPVRWVASTAFTCLAVLAAAGVAALAAHVAIDAFANFYVAHDPYDDIGHDSRFLLLGASIAIAAAGALAVLWTALHDYRYGSDALRRLIGDAVSDSPWAFVAWVATSTYGALVAMELSDAFAATGRICGLSDALGGSVLIGSTIAIAAAIAVSLATWTLLRYLTREHRAIVRAVAALFVGTGAGRNVSVRLATVGFPDADVASVLARRAAKRAPPRRD